MQNRNLIIGLVVVVALAAITAAGLRALGLP